MLKYSSCASWHFSAPEGIFDVLVGPGKGAMGSVKFNTQSGFLVIETMELGQANSGPNFKPNFSSMAYV